MSSDDNDAFDSAGLRLTVDLGALVEIGGTWPADPDGRAPRPSVKADAYGLGIEDVGRRSTLQALGTFSLPPQTKGRHSALRTGCAHLRVVRHLARPAAAFLRTAIWCLVIASEEQLASSGWRCLPTMATIPAPCRWIPASTGSACRWRMRSLSPGDVSRPASFAPVLVMSHLACGDEPCSSDEPAAARQRSARSRAAFEGIEASLAASAGIFLGPDYHFDLTRPGIAPLWRPHCFRAWPIPMRPVATAEARIIQTRSGQGRGRR